MLRNKLKRRNRVAVLGCGPAGLFAAHAFALEGREVFIFSKKRRSEMFGAQYLHAPIPDISGLPRSLSYRLEGSALEYGRKVYGELAAYKLAVSPSYLPEQHLVWDIREAYYKAWDLYRDAITHVEISPRWLESELPKYGPFRVIVSSIPRNLLCTGGHAFRSRPIWAIGDAPERGVFAPVELPPETVICNGLPYVGWYRASNIFGYKSVEWPANRRPPIEAVAQVTKPIDTDCDCALQLGDTPIVRVGRYGVWRKGVLASSAYYETKAIF